MRAFRDRPRADTPPSSWPRPKSHDWHSLSVFLFIDQSQFMVLSGRQLCGFDQYVLNMFVALFRKRCPQNRVCGTLFFSAESAVADRLLDRPEARYVPHLERPGESGNGSDSGNGSEEFDPLR